LYIARKLYATQYVIHRWAVLCMLYIISCDPCDLQWLVARHPKETLNPKFNRLPPSTLQMERVDESIDDDDVLRFTHE
jgi:hypothetical protein